MLQVHYTPMKPKDEEIKTYADNISTLRLVFRCFVGRVS